MAVDVGIIMGSQSDWPTMKEAALILDQLGISYETKIVSAHRTPDRLWDYGKGAAGRIKVIIAGAGAALASLLALAVAGLVNRLPLAGANAAGARAICVIEAQHLLLAFLVSLLGAALSAAFAGYRAARIEPAEGLRDA